MTYDEKLAERIHATLGERADVTEKKMFGGLAYLLPGGMFCGIVKNELMVRVGPEQHDTALAEPHTRPMDFAGRPMRGMIYIEPSGFANDEALRGWVERGLNFVSTLPPKEPKKPRAKAARAKKAS